MSESDDSKQQEPNRDNADAPPSKGSSILDGVASILGRLGELAEKGEELRRQVGTQGLQDSDTKGVFDFAVRFGNADATSSSSRSSRPAASRQAPIRPVRETTSKPAQKTPVEKIRQAVIDTFEEDDHLLVVAEMPGATEESIQVEMRDGRIILKGANAHATFEGDVTLPSENFEAPEYSLNNGMLEVRLTRRTS
jgi:HSP20 family protein